MGDTSTRSGVVADSDSSVRVSFQYNRRQVRVFIPVRPTKTALQNWNGKRAVLVEEIKLGKWPTLQLLFAHWFPWDKRASASVTAEPIGARLAGKPWQMKFLLRAWLDATRLENEITTALKDDQVIENILVPWLGEEMPESIDTAFVLNWRASTTLKRKTISNRVSILRRCFDWAVLMKYMSDNPLAAYRVKRRKQVDGRRGEQAHKHPLLDTELRDVLNAALERQRPELHAYIVVAIEMGLRKEEMLGLWWDSVSLDKGSLHICRARVKNVTKDVKTVNGERWLALTPDALRAFKMMRLVSAKDGVEVFYNARTGRRWSEPTLDDTWSRTLATAGIAGRGINQLRHTFAHRALTGGESIEELSEQMGHANIAITASDYGGLLKELEGARTAFGKRRAEVYSSLWA